ncbi:MAG: CAP domain-containing protein [Solirubrobacterales bacterium]
MNRKGLRRYLATAGCLVALAVAGPIASASACSGARQTPPQLTAAEAKRAIICLINKKRAHFHQRKLHGNSQLTSAAEDHSASMNQLNYFAHESSSDGSPVSRISNAGYMSGASSWMVGENLRWGTGTLATPKSTVAAWMASPEHRTVMLSGGFRDIGIGFVPGSPTGSEEGAAAIYTADFGYRS